MVTKVGINGFGRIGRSVIRAWLKKQKQGQCMDIEIVAVNDLPMPVATLSHLLKYDTIMGMLDENVICSDIENEKFIMIGEKKIKIFDKKNPEEIPWKDKGVDIVVESTGVFRARDDAAKHLKAGAKKVVVTAPMEDDDVTIVLGVNDNSYEHERHNVISNASCTTNCLAPIAKVLMDNYGIAKGFMTTVHSYTGDQRIHDLAHKDLRRARAGAENIIPTTTGAAKALGKVIPALDGKMDGMAIRVPSPNVSLVDLVCELKKETTPDDINNKMKQASQEEMKGVLDVSEEPLVSKDYNGNPYSSIVDSLSTKVINGRLVKIISWYDNEWGYSNRVIDLIKMITEKGL